MHAVAAADASFDRYARMLRRTLDVPVALVSLVQRHRQVFPGAVGLPAPYQERREMPLSHSFCRHVVADAAPLVVADAREDDRLRDNLAICELGVVAYAGWPLTDHDGLVIGSLCAIDTEPRDWTEEEVAELEDLAAACSAEIAQRGLRDLATRRARSAAYAEERARVQLALSEALAGALTIEDVSAAINMVTSDVLGCHTTELWLRHLPDPAAAAMPPVAGDHGKGEVMRLVPNRTEGFVGVAPRRLLGGTPGDDALLHGKVVFFGTKQAEREAYGDMAQAERPGNARTYLPLMLADQVFGVLVLTWPDERVVADDDVATVENLMSYTAQAVLRALLLQERIDVSLTLQNALLSRLPETTDVDLAARYQPAGARDRVGGDWYDAVALPDGDMSVIVGDVVGHDMAAAAKMGTLRHMLRTLAWAQPDAPSTVVARLDRAVADLDLGIMASLLYARVEQTPEARAAGRYTLRWTNAGHLPPTVIDPDGTARLLTTAAASDPMLGVLPDRERHDHVATIEAGATLLIYTDGLVERRGEDIDSCLDRLCDAAARHADLPVGDLLDAVIGDLTDDDPDDDLAVLAVRLPDQRSACDPPA